MRLTYENTNVTVYGKKYMINVQRKEKDTQDIIKSKKQKRAEYSTKQKYRLYYYNTIMSITACL